MFLNNLLKQFAFKATTSKTASYFGRPLKLKVNKFASGALSQHQNQDQDIDEQNKHESNEEKMRRLQEEEENIDFSSKSKGFNFKAWQSEQEENSQNSNFKVAEEDKMHVPQEKVLEKFTKQNEMAEYENESDGEDNKKLKALGKEDDRIFTKEKIQFIKESLLYEGEDPYYEKLVNRPEKGVVWGLGGELLRQQKNFFEKGKFPTVEQVISFLELEQGKDIICVDLEKECKRYDLPRFGIILSTFSCRHNYKMAQNLLKAIKSLEIPEMEGKNFKISGRKDDEWLLVDFNDIAVHMFVEEAREEIDLEWKWRNPPTEEEMKEYEKIQRHKSRKTFFEPLDDY